MVDTFLIWRDQITHPDPEYAIRFAFLMVGFALREVILFERRHIFADVLLLDDDSLKKELPQVFLRYLGVKDSAESVTAPAQSDRSGRGHLVRHRAETDHRNRASAVVSTPPLPSLDIYLTPGADRKTGCAAYFIETD